VKKMAEREGTINLSDKGPVKVTIIDNGEGFENGGGSIPNHDKVVIVYEEKSKSSQ
jgi:hypothetical protein